MPDDYLPPLELDERQWDALGELRRLQNQNCTGTRGMPGLHLATLKPLVALGLVELETGGVDNKGRQWTAGLTDAGRRALSRGDAGTEPTGP